MATESAPHDALSLASALPRSVTTRRRSLAIEIAVVTLLALAVLVPGINRYSLVDPWETHYGEVARVMLQDKDWVHMDWPGGMDPKDHEGFRSKPILSFWLMAGSMKMMGVAKDGGYSGEMVASEKTMVAIRLPFILFAVMGLVLMWWMLARLVRRRVAWLATLIVCTTPFYCLVARQAIPDMPLVGCVIGALAMFMMSVEDGDRPIERIFTLRFGRHRFEINHRHVFILIVGGFLLVQCVYYVLYFHYSPRIAVRRFPNPVLFFPLFMGLLSFALTRPGWMVFRFPAVIIGSIVAVIVHYSEKKEFSLAALDRWDEWAPDRMIIRGLAFPVMWALGRGWNETGEVAERALRMLPIATMRQIYLLWCYAFIGVSILAKGPVGIGVFGIVAVFHVLLQHRWRDLYAGNYEVKRGLLLIIVVFLPWHIGMYLKEGVRFVEEYLFTHILNRAAVGVDNSPGTFAYYTGVIGDGLWLWAALVPPALAAALLRARNDTREGRVRFMVTLWAVCGFAFFFIVQTKFHHYVLPAIPALGILVAFFLDDILAKRERLHPLWAVLGAGIVLLIARDLMWEPERWIEMFVFRYDRPWPAGDPYNVDPSDGFLVLGFIGAGAMLLMATPWRKLGVGALCAAALSICLWSLHAYMPDAGKHWGMREAMRSYYVQRTIYGEKNVYFSSRQLADEWSHVKDKWTFETFIPDTLYVGQPMMIRVQLNKPDKDDVVEQEMGMIGKVTRIGDHDVEVTFEPGERAKIDALVAMGQKAKPIAVRPPIHAVDADRIMAWQLYWRGENFWTADEIFGPLPEMKTGFQKTDNVDFLKYMNDRTKAPLGRRYFIITEAGRGTAMRSLLPTPRARESLEVIDTTSNKFSLVSFYL